MPKPEFIKRKERESTSPAQLDMHDYVSSAATSGAIDISDFALSPLPDSPLQSPATKKGKPTAGNEDPDSIVAKLSALINSRADSLEKVVTMKIEGLKKTIDFISEEMRDMKTKLKEVDAKTKMEGKRLVNCETRIAELERYSRRWNLRLAGVPENDTENITATVSDICQKTVGNVNVKVAESIDIVHRLGRRDHTKMSPRNIIIRFLSRTVRDSVWQAAKKSAFLKNNHLRFAEDLTTEDRDKRRALWPQIKEARDKGLPAFFVAGRAFISGAEVFPASTP